MRHLLDRDDDGPTFEELQPGWARNMVVGLGRLAGRAVGMLANNPLRKGGCLDSQSAGKAARFVRMCNALGVPLLVVVDVPGYLPGVEDELLHRRQLAAAPSEVDALRDLVAEHRRESGGVPRGLALGVIDEVIEPADTRRRLAEAFATARHRRGRHGNIPLSDPCPVRARPPRLTGRRGAVRRGQRRTGVSASVTTARTSSARSVSVR